MLIRSCQTQQIALKTEYFNDCSEIIVELLPSQ